MSDRTYNEDIARALCNQQQCDVDGVMCIVSRQAADEGAGLIRRLTAENERLRREVAALRTVGPNADQVSEVFRDMKEDTE